MKIVVVSGGFDPLHSGHINLLEQAATYGNKLVVLVNSDEWLTRKKGRPFMPFEERSLIIQRMDMVDNVYAVDDTDGSVTKGLVQVRDAFGHDNVLEGLALDLPGDLSSQARYGEFVQPCHQTHFPNHVKYHQSGLRLFHGVPSRICGQLGRSKCRSTE